MSLLTALEQASDPIAPRPNSTVIVVRLQSAHSLRGLAVGFAPSAGLGEEQSEVV